MTSIAARPKQSGGYFIPLGNCADKVLQYTPGSGAGGSYLPGSFAPAAWGHGLATTSRLVSTISTVAAGGILRDEGKTIVSASRTFRKVQLICPTVSTGGVDGPAGATPNSDYLTGYIEIASGANGMVKGGANVSGVPTAGYQMAPVAYYPNLF
jgi:hypothetical protein